MWCHPVSQLIQIFLFVDNYAHKTRNPCISQLPVRLVLQVVFNWFTEAANIIMQPVGVQSNTGFFI